MQVLIAIMLLVRISKHSIALKKRNLVSRQTKVEKRSLEIWRVPTLPGEENLPIQNQILCFKNANESG
jgi:hypothetical protein